MISPGKKFKLSLPLHVLRQGEEAETTLKQLLKRRTILSVYMKNNTGSCDRQNDSLVASAGALDQAGYDVIAVSRDSIGSHRKYAAKKGIPYTLVSDPEDSVAKAADAIVEKAMYGKKYFGPARAAFVLDRDGTVLAVVEKVDPKEHGAQLLATLATL
ncbi:MAG: redoxin domain-containing protein [Opitutaceae bacterium]|jgi:peroxiredoxin Q/BCP|nr:redoxin domain-containing protein [Opitutaceae bacterium]